MPPDFSADLEKGVGGMRFMTCSELVDVDIDKPHLNAFVAGWTRRGKSLAFSLVLFFLRRKTHKFAEFFHALPQLRTAPHPAQAQERIGNHPKSGESRFQAFRGVLKHHLDFPALLALDEAARRNPPDVPAL